MLFLDQLFYVCLSLKHLGNLYCCFDSIEVKLFVFHSKIPSFLVLFSLFQLLYFLVNLLNSVVISFAVLTLC